MANQEITVRLSDVENLSSIICAFDHEQADGISQERVKKLVEDAHTAVITLLGVHATAIYAEEEQA